MPALALVVGAGLLGLGVERPGARNESISDRNGFANVVIGAMSEVVQQVTPVAPKPAGPPTRIVIPSIHVDAALQELHLDSEGVLQAPTNDTDAGWFAEGPAPGEPGPAVLAGHVDSKKHGAAVFYNLSRLKDGAQIRVLRGTVWVTFVVYQVHRYSKDHFPTATVYGPTPGPQLRLITCGGSFDPSAGSYRDNIVVSALPI